MVDVDLIPRSYRNVLRARRTLACYGAALVLLLAAGSAGTGMLRAQLARETLRLAHLRQDAARAAALQGRIAGAEQRRNLLAANARAYAVLRGPGAAAALARALDAALSDRIWLVRVELVRHHEPLQGAGGPVPPGTQRVATAGAAGAQAWGVSDRIALDGRALDQAALDAFLAALAASPHLAGVRFVDSSIVPGDGNAGMLAFRASATLACAEAAP